MRTETKKAAVNAIINYFTDNETAFNDCVEQLDAWDGFLGDDRYYMMDELDEFYSNEKPSEVLRRAYFGHDADTWTLRADGSREYGAFDPMREFFTFNGYGNLVSTDYIDYSAHLDAWTVEHMAECREYIDAINDDAELAELFDRLDAE